MLSEVFFWRFHDTELRRDAVRAVNEYIQPAERGYRQSYGATGSVAISKAFLNATYGRTCVLHFVRNFMQRFAGPPHDDNIGAFFGQCDLCRNT
jgi:hypothetical protein